MVKEILSQAGFIENKTFRKTRFLVPPKTTYAIYSDSYESRGADDVNLIKDHSYTIELYSLKEDPEAEERIENALDSNGISYDKQESYWLPTEQLFQVIYTFDFIEKKGK